MGLGADGILAFWYNKADERSSVATLGKKLEPLLKKFRNITFVIKMLDERKYDAVWNTDMNKWAILESDINSVEIVDIDR